MTDPRAFRAAVVVITGASSGIGRAIALAFAVEGASLVLASRSEPALSQPRRGPVWIAVRPTADRAVHGGYRRGRVRRRLGECLGVAKAARLRN